MNARPLDRVTLVLSLLTALACTRAEPSANVEPLQLNLDLRIGSEDKGAEYQFSDIPELIAHEGLIYVAQRADRTIRVFDGAGNFVRNIGRPGGGPGEFQGSLWHIGFIGDTLWVIDDARRFTYFNRDGEYLTQALYASVSLRDDGPALSYAQPEAVASGDRAFGFAGFEAYRQAEGEVPRIPLLRLTRDGRTLDTLAWTSTEHTMLFFGNGPYTTQPFTDEALHAWSPQGDRLFVVERRAATAANANEFAVIAISTDGDTAWSRTYSYEPIEVEQAAIDSVRALKQRQHRGYASPRTIDESLFVPRYHPPITHVIVGTDGTLWLRGVEQADGVLYSRIEIDGRLIGTATLPRTTKLLFASAAQAWGSQLDENDVPSIVRYAITSQRTRSPSR